MDNDSLLQAFLEEADELLTEYEETLLSLEENAGDAEILNKIFRSAHTIKGNSGMLGFEDIAHFTHCLEDLLDLLRKGVREVRPETVSVLLAAGDVVRGMLKHTRDGSSATPEENTQAEDVQRRLRSLQAGDVPGAAAPPAAPAAAAPVVEPAPAPAAEAPERVLYEVEIRPDIEQAAAFDPTRALAALATAGTVCAVTPDPAAQRALPPAQRAKVWKIQLESATAPAALEALLRGTECPPFKVAAISSFSLDFAPEPAAAPAALPAPAANAPALPQKSREPAGDKTSEKGERSDKSADAAEKRAEAGGSQASIRVPVEKVDRLINLVGELVITQSMVTQTVHNYSEDRRILLEEAVAQMDRHARELRERIMAVRMIPVKTLFSRFHRLVRDLVSITGKKVQLVVSGEETELDKTVIERIGDPLTHLIRNSMDHGLETPAARKAAGKSESGTIHLEAFQLGGSVCIDVSDDGRGLNREKIVEKAIQNRIIAPDQQLADEQVWSLIFKPGFSTAAQVTEISGRGVGMDVVKRNVESLGGTIAIKTEAGKGTQFRISLPLTLAILDGQLVRVGDQVFILPLISITESVRPIKGSVHQPAGTTEIVKVRDQLLPVIRLHEMFQIADAVTNPYEGLLVIVENEGKLAAVLVDELLAQQQVVIKNLEENFRKIEGVTGATILGDGKVALILDVPGLLDLAQSQALQSA